MIFENYRGVDLYRDEKDVYYYRKGNKWYFPSVEDLRADVDEWLS